MHDPDLFEEKQNIEIEKKEDEAVKQEDEAVKQEDRFLFLTHRVNLLSIMSSGLIGPSDVFAKYRDDIQTKTKGFIPLFSEGASSELIDLTTDNVERNFPVILELDKFKLPKNPFAFGITTEGELKEKVGMEDKLLVRFCDIVLSSDMIKGVHFSSDDNLEDFTARMFDNVPIDIFVLSVSPKLFDSKFSFPVKVFDNLKETDTHAIERFSRISDKVAASVALLSESMKKESDVLLLNSLVTYPFDGGHQNMNDEYNSLSKVINAIVSQDNSDSDSNMENILLKIVLNELVDSSPSEGWDALDFLEKIYSSYQSSATEIDEKTAEWFEICKKILNNEMDIPEDRNMFADEKNIIKRAILFFLLRPNYDDIINRENSYLNPGHFVKTLAVLLAGFRVGYERLSIQFKNIHHQIFAPLKAYIINYSLGKIDSSFELHNDIRIEMEPGHITCQYRLLGGVMDLGEIDLRSYVYDVIQKMQDKGHIVEKYDLSSGQLTYRFNYPSTNRKQPVKLDFNEIEDTVVISSPCFEIKKKSHIKKVTKKTLETILTKDYEGKCYWTYEKGDAITLKRVIPHKDIGRLDIIDIIEFIARKADEVEAEVFKQDIIK